MDSDRVKGKAKETEGEIQQKWGEAKDKARDTWEDVKDKAEDVGDEAEDRVDERDETDDKAEGALRLDEQRRNFRATSTCVCTRPDVARPSPAPLRGGAEQLKEGVLGGGQVRRIGAVGRAKVVERATREVVLDDDGAHVGRPRDRRRVSELLTDMAHHRSKHAFRLRLSVRRPAPLRARAPRGASRPRS